MCKPKTQFLFQLPLPPPLAAAASLCHVSLPPPSATSVRRIPLPSPSATSVRHIRLPPPSFIIPHRHCCPLNQRPKLIAPFFSCTISQSLFLEPYQQIPPFNIPQGFFVDLNVFKADKEKASKIAKIDKEVKHVNDNNEMVTKDGLGDEDANLMIKLKFLTYKLRTFLIRNGLSILFKEGSSAYKAYYLRKCVQGLLSVPRLGSQALLGQNPWQELLMKRRDIQPHSCPLANLQR